MNKRRALCAIAIAAVLAVSTPAMAGQWVVVELEVVRPNPVACPVVPGPITVETGTSAFRDAVRNALEIAAYFRENDCGGIARVRITPL